MLRRLLFVLVMLLVPMGAQAATFWESLFNAQDCNWAGPGGACLEVGSGVVQIDTAFAHEGAGSAKYLFNYPQAGSCLYGSSAFVDCGGYWDRSHTATATLWRRVWVRLSSDFVVSSPTTKLLKTSNASNLFSDWTTLQPGSGTQIVIGQIGPHLVTGEPNGRQEWSSGFLRRGTWQCWETGYTLNTPGVANGTLVMYLDGTQILNLNNVNFRSSGDTSQLTQQRIYRQYGQGQINFDQYAVGDTRIGCGGSSPVDTTAPAQVTGLSVVSDTTNSITYTWTANTESDLAGYTIQGCTPGACTNLGTIGTAPQGQNTFTWNGLAANTLYRVRVLARDSSGNPGTASSIVDETTDAASVLPTVTAFTTTATGGQITYTGTPTDFRIAFGGTNGDGSFWSSQIIRTLAQVPGGALSFNWPAGTSFACVHARDAVQAEDPVEYRCNSVTPATPGGTPAGTYLRALSANHRWLTLDGTTALYKVGISGGGNPNASFDGIQDLLASHATFTNLTWMIPSTTLTHTFDGTTTDLGALWTAPFVRLDIVSGIVQPSAIGSDNEEYYTGYLPGEQSAEVTLSTFTGGDFNRANLLVRISDAGADGYKCVAQRNAGSTNTSAIIEITDTAGANLATETATTWAAGNMMRCRAVGSKIYLDRSTDSGANWTNLLSADDATYRTGYVGVGALTTSAVTNVKLDNFKAGPIVADYATMLDQVVADGGNWVRYWTLEQSAWCSDASCAANTYIRIPFTQFPWTWTGTTRVDTSTGTSIEVGVYDVTELNQRFFDRVSERIDAALSRGITPIITMFSGGHLYYGTPTSWNAGFSNPFYSGNNVNGIACDANANEACEENHSLSNTNVNNAQRAYIDRLVQTIGNRAVILEVSNEDQTDSTDWQNMVMVQVRTSEATHGTDPHIIFQSGWFHATYYAAGGASNDHLFDNARNDAISPLCTSDGVNWETNPPANDGSKLIFYDSDHTGYNNVCGPWTKTIPWKLLTRGIYPIFLSEWESAPVQVEVKAAMAQTNLYGNRINLAMAYPETGTSIVSTGYGLFTGTDAGTPNCSEYLMLMPSDGESTIDLTACDAGATFNVEEINVTDGTIASAGTTTGGAVRSFDPAGSDPMVIYLKLDSVTDVTPPVIISCTTSPAGVLPAGTTSVDINCVTDEAATVKMDSDQDIDYALQDTTFGTTGTTSHTQSVGSLADGTSYTRYVRASDGTNATTVDYPVSWSVAADTVTVAPADVTNVRGTLNESTGTILWQWDAVSGADRYVLEISAGDTFLVAVETSANSGTTYQQGNLTANSSYTARAKAINSANQQSANWAQSVAVNTALPPQLTGLTEPNPGVYSNTVILSWDAPTNTSLVSAVERCTGAACTDFTYHGGGNTTGYTDSTVSAGTTYCYRVKFSNPVFGGTSADWSSTYCATTKTVVATGSGLIRPRTPLPYGVYRLPRN